MSNAPRSEYDLYTSAILGEKLTLVLGRPVVANQQQGAFKWAPPSRGVQVERKPTVLLRGIWAVLGVVAIPASIFAGHWLWTTVLSSGQSPATNVSLPVQSSGKTVGSAVRLSDQEYQLPHQAFPAGGPLPPVPMPVPLPVGGGREAVDLPTQLQPVANSKTVEPKPVPAKDTDKEKEKPSAVIIDDGPAKAEATVKAKAPAPTPEAPKKEVPPPSAKLPDSVPGKPQAAPTAKPVAPVTPLAVKPAQDIAAGQRFAQPVEDRGAKLVGSPAAAPNEAGVKITLVDITPGGKKVLVTNPATRLPTALGVGDKLPNGKMIQSIDEKSSSITADGTTYKLD